MALHSEIQRNRDYIRVVIDDGSGYLKVVAQHVLAGESVANVPKDTIQLQEGTIILEPCLVSKRSHFGIGEDKIRQIYVIDGETLHCGEIEVANWLQEHPSMADKVIEVCLLPSCIRIRLIIPALQIGSVS